MLSFELLALDSSHFGNNDELSTIDGGITEQPADEALARRLQEEDQAAIEAERRRRQEQESADDEIAEQMDATKDAVADVTSIVGSTTGPAVEHASRLPSSCAICSLLAVML